MNKTVYHLFISFIFTIIYRLGSFSKITFGDGLEKVLEVEIGKFGLETYSLTHFLYKNFTVGLHKIFPFTDAIEIVRWVNILSAVIFFNY